MQGYILTLPVDTVVGKICRSLSLSLFIVITNPYKQVQLSFLLDADKPVYANFEDHYWILKILWSNHCDTWFQVN